MEPTYSLHRQKLNQHPLQLNLVHIYQVVHHRDDH